MARLIENFHEFAARQNCRHLVSRDRIYFANGAQSLGNETHSEPPEDPGELLRAKLQFAKLDLRIATQEFEQTYRAISDSVMGLRMGCGSGPEGEWRETLSELRGNLDSAEHRLHTLQLEWHEQFEQQNNERNFYDSWREGQLRQSADLMQELVEFRRHIPVEDVLQIVTPVQANGRN